MRTRLFTFSVLMMLSATLSLSAEKKVKGNGNIVTRSIPVDDFDQLRLGDGISYNYK